MPERPPFAARNRPRRSLAGRLWRAVVASWRPRRPRARSAADDAERLASELINDLSAIRGYCELARRDADDRNLARRMDAAIEICTEAAALARRLGAATAPEPPPAKR